MKPQLTPTDNMPNTSQPIRMQDTLNLKAHTMKKCHSDLNVLKSCCVISENSNYVLNFKHLNLNDFNSNLDSEMNNSNNDVDYRLPLSARYSSSTPKKDNSAILDLLIPQVTEISSIYISSSSVSPDSSPEKSVTSSSYCPTFSPGFNPSTTFSELQQVGGKGRDRSD